MLYNEDERLSLLQTSGGLLHDLHIADSLLMFQ
jgi:hypothetical protein